MSKSVVSVISSSDCSLSTSSSADVKNGTTSELVESSETGKGTLSELVESSATGDGYANGKTAVHAATEPLTEDVAKPKRKRTIWKRTNQILRRLLCCA